MVCLCECCVCVCVVCELRFCDVLMCGDVFFVDIRILHPSRIYKLTTSAQQQVQSKESFMSSGSIRKYIAEDLVYYTVLEFIG